jgi:hypothetical protein
MPSNFFLWGYAKNWVFIPPLPHDLTDLKARIIAAVKNIDVPMLTHVWQGLEYRIDVCFVTCGAQMEQLEMTKKNFSRFPVAVTNSIKVGPFFFLVINVCNHGEHYETPCVCVCIVIHSFIEFFRVWFLEQTV